MAVQGKKMAMLIENYFEDIEVSEPMSIFKNAGIQITVVGFQNGAEYTGKHQQTTVKADATPGMINIRDYDVLFIPGGYAPDKMRMHASMVDLVKKFNEAGKMIAALCHGPQMLISAEAVKGRRVTSWPSVAVDLKNAGAEWVDEPVVIDQNIITARKPDDIPQFTKAVIEALQKVPAMAT